MKAAFILTACALLTSCAGTLLTVQPPQGEPISFTTGKDVSSTAKAAALAAAAYWLNLHTRPAVSSK